MALPTGDDCDDCTPPHLRKHSATLLFLSSTPFLLTFFVLSVVIYKKIYPILSGDVTIRQDTRIPQSPFTPRRLQFHTSHNPSSKSCLKRFSALAFSTTVALAVVLVELVLCEISDTINPAAREVALQATVFLLLVLLIGVIPSLEIHSVISAGGLNYTGRGTARVRLAWFLQALGSVVWILSFWGGGQLLLAKRHQVGVIQPHEKLVDAIVEHVGVIGISLMALLSGFASVSSPWQSFGLHQKRVSEGSVERKTAGLEATNDLLAAKRSRLRALEHKASKPLPDGYLQRAIGSIRGNPDDIERKNLQIEITGLENMSLSMSTHRAMLQSQLYQQNRSQTLSGRILLIGSYIFSVYCLYRIVTTAITATRRRLMNPDGSFTGSDPINNILAVFVNHYDPQLDQDAWTRQISFLLSGVMLFASFSSVLQTFHFFARFTPSLIKAAQANLPLIVAQICATYVISAALLLRGMMPGRAVNERLKGLGGEDMAWVDSWFEVWFLAGAIVTAFGIWVGRKIGGGDEFEDDDEGVALGKIA